MSRQLVICLSLVVGVVACVRGSEQPVYDGKLLSEWMEGLKAKEPPTRARAALALGQMGTQAKPAVPALSEALKDVDSAVRGQAAVALWRIVRPVPLVLPALVEARRHTDSDANAALAQIGPAAGRIPGA